jgi:hypothetical protein
MRLHWFYCLIDTLVLAVPYSITLILKKILDVFRLFLFLKVLSNFFLLFAFDNFQNVFAFDLNKSV